MRTFSRADWQAAEDAWRDGGFDRRWDRIRRIARERGLLYPPAGAAHDDREAAAPSQRAVVRRALEDCPRALDAIVRHSRSWSEVVAAIIGLETRLRRESAQAAAEPFRGVGSSRRRSGGMATVATILADVTKRIEGPT